MAARFSGLDSRTIEFNPATGDRAKHVGLRSNADRGATRSSDATYDFVVLDFVEKTLAKSANGYQGELELKRKNAHSPKRKAVPFWVTPAKTLQPVQALGGWLNSTNGIVREGRNRKAVLRSSLPFCA